MLHHPKSAVILLFLAAVTLIVEEAAAFAPVSVDVFSQTKRPENDFHKLFLVDPITVGVAVVSAAAGAASQMPRIQELERELIFTREQLGQSEAELVANVKKLEDKLFQMDEEFEKQSARMKRRYDDTLRQEIEKVRVKVKEDYRFNYEIEVAKEKQRMLQENLKFVNSMNSEEKTKELVALKFNTTEYQIANKKLQNALHASDIELKRLREINEKKLKWWPF